MPPSNLQSSPPTSTMATSQAKTLLLLLLTLFTVASSARVLSSGSPSSVYEVLQQFGLPVGLLPDSVISYSFTDDEGGFAVELKKPCYIKFDYLVYFSKKITGKLSAGAISNLVGLQAQSFIFWLNVDEIRVDPANSNSLIFTLGLITQRLDIKQFETIHPCKDKALVAFDHSPDLVSSKLPVPALSGSVPSSVYEVLQLFGLPVGLLPDSVISYSFTDDEGGFAVELKKPCYIKFDYLVYFSKKITGKLSAGAISNLVGLQAQSFIFWLNVDEIKVDPTNSNNLIFTLGLITQSLDIKQFETVHPCKDKALASSDDQSTNRISKLPVTVDEAEILIEA